MAEVLRSRGCDVSQAGIEFTEPRYLDRFSRFPFRHAVFDVLPLLWPQLRRETGQIRIPDAAKQGDTSAVGPVRSRTSWRTASSTSTEVHEM
jgi:hypothetical protein